MSGKPPDFTPLAASDPVPGDPAYIALLGHRYQDTANEIHQQAGNLRTLAGSTSAGWKGAAGTVFASKADDLAGRISLAYTRYATAAQALTRYAPYMADAQQCAYAAVWKAKAAQDQMQASAPEPTSSAADAGMARYRASLHEEAQQDLAIAQRQFDNAVEDYNNAANAAAQQITAEIGTDPLKDSWWDSHFGTLDGYFELIGLVVLLLVVVALILMCPFSIALFGALAVADATTAIGLTVAALTVIQAVFDGTGMVTDQESWVAFAADLVALATFGFGNATEAIVKTAAESSARIGKAVAFVRAGSDALRETHLPGFLFSLADRSPLAASLLRGLRLGARLDEATAVATGARSVVETAIREAEPGGWMTGFTMSLDVARDLNRIDSVNEIVPDVLRIQAARMAAQAIARIDGIVQWSSFGGSGFITVHPLLPGL